MFQALQNPLVSDNTLQYQVAVGLRVQRLFEDAGDGAAPEGWEQLPLFLVQDRLNWKLIREHTNELSGNSE